MNKLWSYLVGAILLLAVAAAPVFLLVGGLRAGQKRETAAAQSQVVGGSPPYKSVDGYLVTKFDTENGEGTVYVIQSKNHGEVSAVFVPKRVP